MQRRYCDLSLAEVIARDPADEHTTPAVTAIEQEMIHEMTTTEIASLAATRKAARTEAEALSAAKLREVLKAAGRKLPRSKAEGIEALVTLRVEQRAAALKAAKAAAKTAENAGRNERRNARRAEKAAAGKPLAGPTLLDKHEGEHGTLVPKAKVRLHSTLTRTTKEAGGRFTIAKGTTGTLKKLILRGRGVTAVVAIRGEGERNIPVRYLEPVA